MANKKSTGENLEQKYQIVERVISELKRADYNPRKISRRQRESLCESMEKYGWAGSFVVVNVNPERKDIIVSGHQRVDVWEGMGHDTAPCLELNLSPEDEKELNIRLNKNGGEFDNDLLAKFFDKDSLMSFGFTGEELAESFKDDSAIIPVPDEEQDFEIPKMEARLYEHHDYLVFVFDEMHDFLRALNLFNVKRVDSSFSEKNKKIGIGRVIFGKELLKKLCKDDEVKKEGK